MLEFMNVFMEVTEKLGNFAVVCSKLRHVLVPPNIQC